MPLKIESKEPQVKKVPRRKRLTSHQLFLPFVCLIVVLFINVIKTPTFFKVSINDGVLYGYVIDVINRASELVILAVGMTPVTASSAGQDITIGLFIVMYAAGMIAFAANGFAKPQMFLNLFISNAGLIVISCGMTIVMITGGIDISVGSVTALVCMVVAYQMEVSGMNAYSAMVMGISIGVVFGLVQGFLITYLEIQPFIVTLAGLFFGRGMTAVVSTEMISIKNATFLSWAINKIFLPFGTYNKKGIYQPAYIYPTVIIALLVVIGTAVMLKYTKFGRRLYAIGGGQQSALMMGVNIRRAKMLACVLDGFLAGVGGFLFCLNICAGFVEQAKGLEMDAIASSVIGGTLLTGGVGNPVGTLFGVLIRGSISSLITTQGTLSSWWVRIALSVLLCFFIVLQSLIISRKRTPL